MTNLSPEALHLLHVHAAGGWELVAQHQREALAATKKHPPDLLTLHPRDTWHEDDGAVLWHHLDEYGGICESPVVAYGGDDLDSYQQWDNYYAYWSRLPIMERFPLRPAMIAPDHHALLICDGWDFVDG